MGLFSKKPVVATVYDQKPMGARFWVYTGREGWAARPKVGQCGLIEVMDGSGLRYSGMVVQERPDRYEYFVEVRGMA